MIKQSMEHIQTMLAANVLPQSNVSSDGESSSDQFTPSRQQKSKRLLIFEAITDRSEEQPSKLNTIFKEDDSGSRSPADQATSRFFDNV